MSSELINKCVRCFIVVLVFLSLTTVVGMDTREAHQFFFVLGIMIAFGLMVKNIWLTMFLWWTVLLYVYFKFSCGHVYVQNVFFGSLLYYLTKKSFKREHIDFFINAVLWLVAANLVYMIVQICGFDWIYLGGLGIKGFMGAEGICGTFMALAVPLIATRKSKWSWLCALMMFFPLYLSNSITNIGAAGIGLLFVYWSKLPKKSLFVAFAVLLLGAGLYVKFVDSPQMSRLYMWKLAMIDTTLHPISGNGLDSFRNITKSKEHVFITQLGFDEKKMIYSAKHWDNPHNLFISVAYEWGFLGIFFIVGYIRQSYYRYKKALKVPNTIALAGVGIVLLLVSVAHFPLFLARFCTILIPMFALYEVQTA